MKTTLKEEFFSIFALYCKDHHFSSRRFEIVKFDNVDEMDLETLYWKGIVFHKPFDKSLFKTIKEMLVSNLTLY